MPTPSLIIPSAPVYDEGNLYGLNVYGTQFAPEAIPFTRATTATRTNAAGLVELVPYNLLQYSEQFNNNYWVKDSGVSVDANVTNAPDGTLTADRLNFSTVGAVYNSGLALGTGSFTFSVWLKAEGVNIGKQILLEFTGGNATVTLTGDWQRFTTVGSNVTFVAIKRNTVGQADYVYAWGAQVVQGTSALPYLKTETRLNRPRVDFSLGGCPNLLLEPQRTNLALQSSSFDNTTTWTSGISGTGVNPIRTANTTISPSGIQDADTIVFNRGAGNTLNDFSVIQQTVTIPTTGTYYISVWLKATASGDIGKQVFIRCGGGGVLQAVTLTSNWVRYETTTSVTAGADIFQVGNRGTVTNANSVSVDIWGAQLELGAYATTYIPTTTATVTRNADSFTESNIFSRGMITAAGGTWFVELRNNRALISDAVSQGIYLETGTGWSNGFSIRGVGGISGRVRIYKNLTPSFTPIYVTTTDTCKLAIKWNGATADVFENGVKVVAATAFNITNMQNLGTPTFDIPAYINQMALYPTPLSDTECINLTTL